MSKSKTRSDASRLAGDMTAPHVRSQNDASNSPHPSPLSQGARQAPFGNPTRPAAEMLAAVFVWTVMIAPAAGAGPPAVAGEAQFFVDAARGEDGNSGSTADQPLKTLWAAQKLMDKVPADMRVVLNLARGSVWREDIGLPTRKEYIAQVCWKNSRPLLTLRPYGEGDKPTISGLDPLPNQAFRRRDATAFPNVWSQRVTPTTTYTRDFQGVIVAGNRPLREASLLKAR